MARVRRSRAEWGALVRAWTQSGEDAATFAAKHDLGVETLRWWRTQLRSTERALDFVDAVVEEPRAEPFVVVISTGHRVVVPHGFDGPELRRLVEVLC